MVIEIKGEPWFVAKDVCDVLGLKTFDVVRRLNDDEKSYMVRTHVGMPPPGRDIVIVNEPGLYKLIMQSRKSEAEEWKRWVTHDVLPRIRFSTVLRVVPTFLFSRKAGENGTGKSELPGSGFHWFGAVSTELIIAREGL